MADPKKLIPFILRWEGGFANNPLDRGGATNKGITIGTYRQFYGKERTVDDLKALSNDEWLHIFLAGYWRPWKAGDIENQAVANICVDWAWASGVRTAIKEVQSLVGVSVDGIVGPKTLSAINGMPPRHLFEKIKSARLQFVLAIVRRSPSQKVFINGWKNRINSIEYSDES